MLNGNPRIKTGAIWCPDHLGLKKLKFREGKFSPQGHTAINCQSWVWNSSLQVFLLIWFRAHLGEGSSLQRQRTQVVSPLTLLVQAAGTAGAGSWKALDATKQKSQASPGTKRRRPGSHGRIMPCPRDGLPLQLAWQGSQQHYT